MTRALPIVERELRKFIRTPVLLVMTLFMPVLNLVVLGNAFGGRVRHLNVAVVDEDGGPAARRVIEAIYSLQMNGDVVRPIAYPNEAVAARDVREGAVQGAVVLPASFSRHVYAGENPHVGLLLDNTDGVVSGTLQGLLSGAVASATRGTFSVEVRRIGVSISPSSSIWVEPMSLPKALPTNTAPATLC